MGAYLRGLIFAAVLALGGNFAARAAEDRILWEVEIEGNSVLDDDEIKDAIVSKESSHFPILGRHREYNAIAAQLDQQRIEHLYRRKGYYRVKVAQPRFNLQCKKPDRVCLVFSITEGEPTRVSSVKIVFIDSAPPYDPSSLLPVFGLAPGEVFDHDRYLSGKEGLLEYFKSEAYPLAKVDGQAVYDGEKNEVSVRLQVDAGVRSRLSEIFVEGLDQILLHDVRPRIPLRSGEWYNPSDIEEAKSLLADLDIFSAIDVDIDPAVGREGYVNVIFRVREKPLRTLQFGTGVRIENSRQEARLAGEWSHRNFYQRLRRFSVRVDPRYAVLPSVFNPQESGPLGTFEVLLRQPAFLNPRQDLRTSVSFDSDLEQGFRWYGPKFAANIDRRVTQKLSLGVGYSFQYLTFYDVDIAFNPESRLVPPELLFQENYRLGLVHQRLTYDRRDNGFEPNRGYYAQLEVSESLPAFGSAFKHVRYRPELRGYSPVSRRATAAGKVTFGHLLSLRPQASAITERFYGGGANSHRGFTYHRLSPQVLTRDGRSVPVGGDFSFLVSLEQRFDLFELAGSWLIGAFFLDAGDVVEAPRNFDFRYLHYAAGTGLRYDSPVGILRADVGIRLNRLEPTTAGRVNPDPGQRFAFHLSLGEAF
ncbi:MAG: BamA/TamA family outer membrane protein [Bdellovibrionota bacterium]